MEFRRGKPGRRHNRRICPRCKTTCGQKKQCPACKSKSKARIEIVWYVDGKRERELTYCWREEAASAVLQRKEADYWRQQDLGVEREVGGTLCEAVEAFLGTRGQLSVNYMKQMNTSLKALASGIGWDCPIQRISATDIIRYRDDGLVTLASSSVRSYMLVLRRFFAFLHDEGWIRRNPAKKVKLPPAKKGRDHLRPDEVGMVLDACWQTEPFVAPILTTFVLGGWRKGELVNLRWRDVDLDQGWAYVLDFEGDDLTEAWSPKTENSRRAVPLHPQVVRALKRVGRVMCVDGRVSPWVFPITDKRKQRRYKDKLGRLQRTYGERRSPGTWMFGDVLGRVLERVEIDRRVTIHGLRRTFAILMPEADAPEAVIQQALGHGAKGVTRGHYLPRRDKLVKRWVDAIEVSIPALDIVG